MEKNFRIKTNIGSDSVVRVNLRQDIDTFDILSLNISTDGSYKSFSANYGVIVGRVVGNGGIGIPNAKISVFIPLTETDKDRPDVVALYPFKTVTDIDSNGRRYNLLPAEYHDNEHVAVGTFPTPQMVLDNDICLEIYEKYFKLSTVTNQAGDYMITNVPVGTQTLHMDVDISDIGYLSQKPYDLIYKGYDKSMFENSKKFKRGTNLDILPQIYSQNDTITVYPFWGDDENNEIAITRKDFKLQYEFQPTAVFMGSSFTDQDSNYVSENCIVADKCGEASQLKTSRGTIAMMREALDGTLEEVDLGLSNQIDGNGVWCIQVPMNLDYITTNENGEIVRTKDPSKGIPTRARVRFKINLDGDDEDASVAHPLTYYIPANLGNDDVISGTTNSGRTFSCVYHDNVTSEVFNSVVEKMTYWGNNPRIADDCFKNICMRDMLWNCVYSVKNYIPRIQMIAGDEETNETDSGSDNWIDYYKTFEEARGFNHTGIKGVNKKNAKSLNPLPYNKINLGLSYGTWSESQSLWNSMTSWYDRRGKVLSLFNYIGSYQWQRMSWVSRFFRFFGFSRRYFYNFRTYESVATEDEILAATLEEKDGVAYDFYNDWLNGSVYFPKVKFDLNDNANIPLVTALNKGNIFLNDSCCLDYRYGNKGADTKIINMGKGTGECIVTPLFGNSEGKILFTPPTVGQNVTSITWNAIEEKGNGVNNFATHTGAVDLRSGFIYKSVGTSDENNITYVYSPVLGSIYANSNRIIFPGFRTDLILLGSVDENNVMGIPNVKNLRLPKTSSNIVPMYRAEVPFDINQENGNISSKNDDSSTDADNIYGQELEIGKDSENDHNDDISNLTFVGLLNGRIQQTTGAFWGTAEYTPWYVYTIRWYRYWGGWWAPWWGRWFGAPVLTSSKTYFTDRRSNTGFGRDMGAHSLLGQGLFFGRTAFSMFSNMYVTKPKSCINLSRICELSVTNEDSIAYKYWGDGWVNADTIGVITDEQIVSPLPRTMFATLNGKALNAKTSDDSLAKYDLSYKLIDGFDGFLSGMAVKQYVKGGTFTVTLSETKSNEYINFRYGQTKRFNARYHFDREKYRFPIYENSFYFYFGLDSSHTALDKYNEIYCS